MALVFVFAEELFAILNKADDDYDRGANKADEKRNLQKVHSQKCQCHTRIVTLFLRWIEQDLRLCGKWSAESAAMHGE